MLIVCPNCTTSYDLDLSRLGGAGRRVRCARCREMWIARAPAPALEGPPVAGEELPAARPAAARMADEATAFEPLPAPPSLAELLAAGDAATGAAAKTAEAEGPPPVIAESPPLAPLDEPSADELPPDAPPPDTPAAIEPAAPAEAAVPGEDVETIALRRGLAARKARRRDGRSNVLLCIIACLLALAALALLRVDVVRLAPQTEPLFAAAGLPVNLRGFEFRDVRTFSEPQQRVPVLVVEGRIVNVTGKERAVPRVRFAVHNAAGLEIYAWTMRPIHETLTAGENLSFRSRLASPPRDAAAIAVRFLHPRDMTAAK